MESKLGKILVYTCVPYEGHEKYGGAVAVAWDTVHLLRKNGVEVVAAFYKDWNGWGGSSLVFQKGNNYMEDELCNVLENDGIKVALLADILPAKENRIIESRSIPIIQEIHGHCFPSTLKHRLQLPIHKRWKEFFWELRHRYMCRFAQLVLRPSRYAAEGVIDNYKVPADRVRVVYNSVNLELFSPTIRQTQLGADDKCVFINAGRMAPNRNFLECIQVYEKVVKLYPNCELKLAGDGYQMKICKKYTEENAIPNVHFLGSISRQQLAHHYQESDILLNTSEFETFGCVIVEGMSTGLPILAYEVTSIPEVAPPNKVGILCKPNDLESHVENAIKLIKSPELRVKLGLAGRQQCKKLYSEDNKFKRLMEIFNEVI